MVGFEPRRSASTRACVTCCCTRAVLRPACFLGVSTAFRFIFSPHLSPGCQRTCSQNRSDSQCTISATPQVLRDKLPEHRHHILPSDGQAFGRSLPCPQVCRNPCAMTWERALCRGSGAEHDVLVLVCGLVALGRSLASGPHARVLASLRQRKPHLRLFLAMTTQSSISNPFPQGKHLLIILKVWTLKDAKWVFPDPLMLRPSCD